MILVLRRLEDPRIARFLTSPDPKLATEAARAINDLPIEAGTPALARLIASPLLKPRPEIEPLARRAINACFRLGGRDEAEALAAFAADPQQSSTMRAEALAALGDWERPSPRDRVTGFWRPLPKRDVAVARGIVEGLTKRLLAEPSGPLQARAIEVAGKLGVSVDRDALQAILADPNRSPALRLASLRRLGGLKAGGIDEILATAFSSGDQALRIEARRILNEIDPDRGLKSIQTALDDATAPTRERQETIALLGKSKSPAAAALLSQRLNDLVAGNAPSELGLDIVEAASERGTPELRAALARWESSRPKNDPSDAFRTSLDGGDASKGREIFTGHRLAQCGRCHSVGGSGGTAGPDLSKVAAQADRKTLRQSLIEPDAKITPGFGTVALSMRDGRVVTGAIKSEADGIVVVEPPDGRPIRLTVGEIDERSTSKSAMPAMGTILSPRELRDIIEYLSTLK